MKTEYSTGFQYYYEYMNYYTIAPSKTLSAYARFFWVLESDEPYCHR
ncbi:MAG: hypothetical protein ACXWC7_08115 [Chitinophagaceae bacterium]